MNLQPYVNHQDLNAMLDLLAIGRKANSGSYYVHRGDVQWWLFYTDTPPQVWQSNIRLLKEDEKLLGWILLSKDENAFDIYVMPNLRGSSAERDLYAWAIDHLSKLETVDAYWVAEDDSVRIELLKEFGFAPKETYTVLFMRDLSELPKISALPNDFALRHSRGNEEDAKLRSVASHSAFESEKPFEEYWQRTWKFMQSPAYVPQHEIFLTAPSGQVASYCIVWTDELNKEGHFEPVGTHADFQRRGLGKRLMYDCFRRLKDEGMETASVCTGNLNDCGIALYEATGFRRAKKLLTFTKRNTP